MNPLIIDSFAGGGGASTGIERACGRSPDIAVNHDAAALAMHQANHPDTLHLNSNVWTVNPRAVCGDRPVALAWFSPDCKHHSKAKGGKPVKRNIRDLAWVVVYWAKVVRPRVIFLENVEEFQDWGPLTEDMKPCPKRKGQTFNFWVEKLRRLGYHVDWRKLRACDYGAPTIRKRLFLVARCDGLPIKWPEPTHAAPNSLEVASGALQPWRTAADIIDWSLPCPSIFDTSEEIMAKHGLRAVRPLAEATMKRIARGIQKFVIDAKEPFIVVCNHAGDTFRGQSIAEPLATITAARDATGLVVPTVVSVAHGYSGGRREYPIDNPLGTVAASATQHALVSAFIAQHNTGAIGRAAPEPLSTLTSRGTQQQLVAASMINLRGTSDSQLRGMAIDSPVRTVSAGGGHSGLVAAFLQKYYGTGQSQSASDPLHTLGTVDTFGLVTVEINGTTYAITDIGMRMLTPREQFRAQGFPDSYVIDRGADGRAMTATEQVRMCGNSVCPPVAEALVRANIPQIMEREVVA